MNRDPTATGPVRVAGKIVQEIIGIRVSHEVDSKRGALVESLRVLDQLAGDPLLGHA